MSINAPFASDMMVDEYGNPIEMPLDPSQPILPQMSEAPFASQMPEGPFSFDLATHLSRDPTIPRAPSTMLDRLATDPFGRLDPAGDALMYVAQHGEIRGTGPGESRNPRTIAIANSGGPLLQDRIAQDLHDYGPVGGAMTSGQSLRRVADDFVAGRQPSVVDGAIGVMGAAPFLPKPATVGLAAATGGAVAAPSSAQAFGPQQPGDTRSFMERVVAPFVEQDFTPKNQEDFEASWLTRNPRPSLPSEADYIAQAEQAVRSSADPRYVSAANKAAAAAAKRAKADYPRLRTQYETDLKTWDQKRQGDYQAHVSRREADKAKYYDQPAGERMPGYMTAATAAGAAGAAIAYGRVARQGPARIKELTDKIASRSMSPSDEALARSELRTLIDAQPSGPFVGAVNDLGNRARIAAPFMAFPTVTQFGLDTHDLRSTGDSGAKKKVVESYTTEDGAKTKASRLASNAGITLAATALGSALPKSTTRAKALLDETAGDASKVAKKNTALREVDRSYLSSQRLGDQDQRLYDATDGQFQRALDEAGSGGPSPEVVARLRGEIDSRLNGGLDRLPPPFVSDTPATGPTGSRVATSEAIPPGPQAPSPSAPPYVAEGTLPQTGQRSIPSPDAAPSAPRRLGPVSEPPADPIANETSSLGKTAGREPPPPSGAQPPFAPDGPSKPATPASRPPKVQQSDRDEVQDRMLDFVASRQGGANSDLTWDDFTNRMRGKVPGSDAAAGRDIVTSGLFGNGVSDAAKNSAVDRAMRRATPIVEAVGGDAAKAKAAVADLRKTGVKTAGVAGAVAGASAGSGEADAGPAPAYKGKPDFKGLKHLHEAKGNRAANFDAAVGTPELESAISSAASGGPDGMTSRVAEAYTQATGKHISRYRLNKHLREQGLIQ